MVRHADSVCLAFPNDPLANADATGRKLSETAAELVGDSCRLALQAARDPCLQQHLHTPTPKSG